ncbi:hypothetical protein PLEOSDRAFT_1100921 [Pleurotus ostreatus PC15]|uniref:Uncharacterized protein n=1 Tax=Pleurotus ostreatus (strain PC15) TaxID=1137138 RepID=A0A067P970_PLEO1|nr:hypothetical protein PLEOSDRAFT_1100921 [Pleurotus ostreatus PC15]
MSPSFALGPQFISSLCLIALVGPSKVGLQVSQEQDLAAEHTPPVLEHAAEQADDWMATRGRDEMLLPRGSLRMSDTESQSTARLSRAIQVLDESATDWIAESGVEREEFAAIGSGAKADGPA